MYVTAVWPGAGDRMNEAVIWDQIITAPSADYLSNLGPVALRKLKRSAKGKSVDPSRWVFSSHIMMLVTATFVPFMPAGAILPSTHSRPVY